MPLMRPPITTPAQPASPPRPWRAREQEGAAIAAAVVALCLLFSAWPQLDLHIGAWFREPATGFVGNRQAWALALYWSVPWLGRAALLAALLVGALAWRRARWLSRRCVALALVLLLGVGAIVNGGLKEHWGRARPVAVQPLGGPARFVPALQPSAQCAHNCSFVSGHAATGFALMAWGCLGAPHRRRRWRLIGAAAGLAVGLGRMAQGGHFVSDVLFAGLVVWACCWALRAAWLLGRLGLRGWKLSPPLGGGRDRRARQSSSDKSGLR